MAELSKAISVAKQLNSVVTGTGSSLERAFNAVKLGKTVIGSNLGTLSTAEKKIYGINDSLVSTSTSIEGLIERLNNFNDRIGGAMELYSSFTPVFGEISIGGHGLSEFPNTIQKIVRMLGASNTIVGRMLSKIDKVIRTVERVRAILNTIKKIVFWGGLLFLSEVILPKIIRNVMTGKGELSGLSLLITGLKTDMQDGAAVAANAVVGATSAVVNGVQKTSESISGAIEYAEKNVKGAYDASASYAEKAKNIAIKSGLKIKDEAIMFANNAKEAGGIAIKDYKNNFEELISTVGNFTNKAKKDFEKLPTDEFIKKYGKEMKKVGYQLFSFTAGHLWNLHKIIKLYKRINSLISIGVGLYNKALDSIASLRDVSEDLATAERSVAMFGVEGSSAILSITRDIGKSFAMSESEIYKMVEALAALGMTNKQIKDTLNLSGMYSDLTGGDFNAIVESLNEAFRKGSVDGLTMLFGGGDDLEKRLKKNILGALKSKDVDSALEEIKTLMAESNALYEDKGFENTVNNLGAKAIDAIKGASPKIKDMVTDVINSASESAAAVGIRNKMERVAKEIQTSTSRQVEKLVASYDFTAHDIKTAAAEAIRPIIDDLYEFFANEEDRQRIIDITKEVGNLVVKIWDFGKAVMHTYEENKELFNSLFMLAGLSFGITHFVRVFTFLKEAIGGVSFVTKALIPAGKAAMNTFKGVPKTASNFKRLGLAVTMFAKALFSKSFAMPILVLTAAIVGLRAIFRKIGGKDIGLLETVVAVAVGGIAGIVYGLYDAWIGFYNTILTLTEYIVNGVCGAFKLIKDTVQNFFRGLVSAVLQLVESLIGKIADLIEFVSRNPLGEALGIDDAARSLKEIKQNISDVRKGWGDKYSDYSKKTLDLSGIKGKFIDPRDKQAEWIGGAFNALGLGKHEDDTAAGSMKKIAKESSRTLKSINEIKEDTGDMSHDVSSMSHKEEDLRWMKDLAEQRFVNDVNLRQLTPTINLTISGTNNSPQDYARAIERELRQMADAGSFNAYGEVG